MPKNRENNEAEALLPMTPAVFYVTLALAEGEKHGYAIMQQVETLSDGRFRMGPGTLYTTLQRLLKLDVIEETRSADEGDARRRYYRLKRAGHELLQNELKRMESALRFVRRNRLVANAD